MFSAACFTGDDGKPREYDLADSDVQITVGSGEHKGRVLELRQVTRRKPGKDGGMRQAHILTTRGRHDLPAAAVAFRMSGRWREENYFRYGRAHFALDALDSYKTSPDDMTRRTRRRRPPEPDHGGGAGRGILQLVEPGVAAGLAAAQDAAKAVPAEIPLKQHNPKMVRLDTQTKLIAHAIRMAAFNTEVMLARALHGHYARAGDEAASLIREALTTSGDIIPGDGVLIVRLDPLSAPRRTRAPAALCDQFNQTRTA